MIKRCKYLAYIVKKVSKEQIKMPAKNEKKIITWFPLTGVHTIYQRTYTNFSKKLDSERFQMISNNTQRDWYY